MPVSRPLGSSPFGGTGASQTLADTFRLQVGPENVTPFLRWGSYRIKKELNGRNECSFTLVNSSGYIPSIGAEVVILYFRGVEFLGTVHERDVQFISEGGDDYTMVSVRCVDVNAVADRRVVVEVYEEMRAGAIVRDIWSKYLSDEFITTGTIQDGPVVTRMVIPYLTVAATFDELSEQSGFHWNIDTARALHFVARTTSPAPFEISGANAVFRGMRGSRTRNQYRNVQYLDGGKGVTDQRSERFRGDGVQRTFTVEYKIFEEPTITRNLQPQTVGLRGIDEDRQWYWNSNENAIGQDQAQPLMQSTDILEVTYRGSFNLIAIVEEAAAVVERQSVELGSGRYEQIVRDEKIDGQDLVYDKAVSLLRRYSTMDNVIDFETDTEGLDVGHMLTVNVPELGQVGEYLITSVEINWTLPERRRFRIGATTGELKGRFQDFFTQVLGGRQSISIREGDILQEVLWTSNTVRVSDSMEMTLTDAVDDEIGTGDFGTAEMG